MTDSKALVKLTREEIDNLKLRPLSYPLTAADVPRAIDRTVIAISYGRHALEKEFSIEWLDTELRKGLREGRLSLTIKAVEAAEKHDDEIADAALREVGSELQTLLVQKRDLAPGHLQVIAYFQRAAQRDRVKRGPGRRWYDHWTRNLAICVWADLACRDLGVPATRNRGSRRANRNPSGISIVVAALAEHDIHLDESSVQENLWFGLPGELARMIVPAWLETRKFRWHKGLAVP